MTRILGIFSFCLAVATMSSACFFQFDVGCVEDDECPAGTTCNDTGQCEGVADTQPTNTDDAPTDNSSEASDDGKADGWAVAEEVISTAAGTTAPACNTWWDCPHEQVCSGLRRAATCVAPENCTLAFENFGEGTCAGSLRCADTAASIECTYDGNISTCASLREDGQVNEFVAGGMICEDAVRLFDQVNSHANTRVFPNDAR